MQICIFQQHIAMGSTNLYTCVMYLTQNSTTHSSVLELHTGSYKPELQHFNEAQLTNETTESFLEHLPERDTQEEASLSYLILL